MMVAPTMTPELANVLSKLQGARSNSRGGFDALCPAHHDHDPSLSVGVGKNGGVMLHCHAGCAYEQICEAMGIEPRDCFPASTRAAGEGHGSTRYPYIDENGELLFYVVRRSGKQFSQYRLDEEGGIIDGLRAGLYAPKGKRWRPLKPGEAPKAGEEVREFPECRRVLYGLPELLAADPALPVFLPEGEKDADNVRALGLVAVTNPGGAGKWRNEFNGPLQGRRVVILPDNDAPGIAHAQHVAESLNGSGVIARVLPLPGLGEKEDVSDWIAAGGTAEQLMELALASLSSKPPANLTQDTQEFQDVQDTQDYQESINVGKGNDGAERVVRPSSFPPVSEWVMKACESNREARKRREADLSRPITPLFVFVRLVKSHPDLAESDAATALAVVERILAEASPSSSDPWQERLGVPAPDAAMEFYDAWDRVRAPLGTSPLAEAVEDARLDSHDLATRGCAIPAYNLFLNVVQRLQDQRPDHPTPISTRRFGEAMGVTHETVARYCKTAVREGFLALAKSHEYRSAGGSKCAEYRFALASLGTGGRA